MAGVVDEVRVAAPKSFVIECPDGANAIVTEASIRLRSAGPARWMASVVAAIDYADEIWATGD